VKQLFDDASAHVIRLSDPDVDLPLASDDNLPGYRTLQLVAPMAVLGLLV
jgi:hypothetical protein